jgi:SAM-dependent methyltransferase
MTIDYNHFSNAHSRAGAKAALPLILENRCPKSLLDVGCGIGTWVRAAIDYGIGDVYGLDGVDIPERELLFSKHLFQQQDFAQIWNLKRKFDIIICLEVGEHLFPGSAVTLVQTLVAHSEVIVFSAACPGQTGQHHVNCQWPEYWQQLFNAHGYVCEDSIRWKIWKLEAIEPWYRQNAFVVRKAPSAGSEPRIARVIHPDMLAHRALDIFAEERASYLAQIEAGQEPFLWYLAAPFRAGAAKLKRQLRILER